MLSEAMFSDEQLKAIGCLALESQRLDDIADSIIREYCSNLIAELWIGRMMVRSKLKILRDLLLDGLTDESLKQEYESLNSRMTTDIDLRNTVIHGEWRVPGDGIPLRELLTTLVYRSIDAVAVKGDQTIKASEIMELALRFDRHYKELIQIWIKIEEALPNRRGA